MLVTFVQIVTFVELPGSCHPTKQILIQIIVFVIFILFAVKLPPYYSSCHCTRQFFVIFVKIVLFDVFAVKLTPYHPSSHLLRYLSTDRKMYYELFDEPNLFI